ncbi:alpha/beta-hydrolase [Ascodesmis nigricans]|uniref:Alpha/beta-hydrolase n=1 Tax=Ascodesmis nigricans TaxID=341454 RepID=A0A4S2MNR7_9PEZI|nr:alpha/beta-hydrolase [Ascodesmis nigricans]
MSCFAVTKHIIPASYIRENKRGTLRGFVNVPQLQLAVNQYTPKRDPGGVQLGDVSIICCHANGFHKELYEPYFDDLNAELEANGMRIHTIFAIDAAHQGESGVLNEALLGDYPSWHDYARDILQVVNHFAAHLTPPIIGIGHSFGGHAIVRASIMHPSLFSGIVLLDPVVQARKYGNPGHYPAIASAKRRDTWPSLQEATKFFESRAFYKAWDPRVLRVHLQYGLRDTGKGDGSVTLTTTKYQEVFTFLDCTTETGVPGARWEPEETFYLLHMVKTPLLWCIGENSPFTNDDLNQAKLEKVRGSELVVVADAGHLVAQEKPKGCAEYSAKFLSKVVKQWKVEAEEDAGIPRQRVFRPEVVAGFAKL